MHSGRDCVVGIVIEQGVVDPMQIGTIKETYSQVVDLRIPEPGADLDARFYYSLIKKKKGNWFTNFSWDIGGGINLSLNTVACSVLLLLIGYLLSNRSNQNT